MLMPTQCRCGGAFPTILLKAPTDEADSCRTFLCSGYFLTGRPGSSALGELDGLRLSSEYRGAPFSPPLATFSSGTPEPGRGRLSLDRPGWPCGEVLFPVVIFESSYGRNGGRLNAPPKPVERQAVPSRVQLPIELVDFAHFSLLAQAFKRCVAQLRLVGPTAKFDLGR